MEFCVCYFAITQMGAACLPLNYRLSAQETEYQMKDTESKVLIFEDIYLERIQSIIPNLPPETRYFLAGKELPREFKATGNLKISRKLPLLNFPSMRRTWPASCTPPGPRGGRRGR